MTGFSTELKVGAFALVILCILSFMTFKVGGLEWTKTKGYPIYVSFNNTAGLDQKTKVKVAGVDAGVVEAIDLHNGRARVRLSIDRDIILYRDAVASIQSSGLLGDKFLSITIGSPEQPRMKEGDTIGTVIEVVDVDELARDFISVSKHFSALAENLNEVLGNQETKNSLNQTIATLGAMTSSLNRTIEANDYRFRKVLDNINSLTVSMNSLIEDNREPLNRTLTNMKDFSGSLKTNGPELVENLNKATKELRDMLEENRPGVKSVVKSMGDITGRIEKGEGSLGKIIKDDHLYESVNNAVEGVNRTISAVERFRTIVSFQTEYLTRPKDMKGYFYVTLQPRPDRYYILGVVSDPVGSVTSTQIVTTTSAGTSAVTQEEIKKKIKMTAQVASRVGDVAGRVGITENTFGVGGDYFFNADKGKITADVWDFSKDELDATSPHVKVGVDYYLFKNLFVSAGADNIMNKKWRGGYVGGGLRFEGDDLNYLFGNLSKVPAR